MNSIPHTIITNAQPARPKILVIADNDKHLQWLSDQCRQLGYEPVGALVVDEPEHINKGILDHKIQLKTGIHYGIWGKEQLGQILALEPNIKALLIDEFPVSFHNVEFASCADIIQAFRLQRPTLPCIMRSILEDNTGHMKKAPGFVKMPTNASFEVLKNYLDRHLNSAKVI